MRNGAEMLCRLKVIHHRQCDRSRDQLRENCARVFNENRGIAVEKRLADDKKPTV